MLIMRVCWTRRGVRKFTEEVNCALKCGRELALVGPIQCCHGFFGLRLVFWAVLK